MSQQKPSGTPPQITILDAGGQYCHLISRKVRELGVFCEVRSSDTPAAELGGRKGLILSGGPASVYEPGSPRLDHELLELGIPVLGICYGLQWMAHALGGTVVRGERGEYGEARLLLDGASRLLAGLEDGQRVWMSHRDSVVSVPEGFEVLAHTEHCPVAAMGHEGRALYGVQFHPEVAHTEKGLLVLGNFLWDICGCQKDWDHWRMVQSVEEEVRRVGGGRRVFFFVSGGVDSTVAYAVSLRTLGAENVKGVYVDTGLMREGESQLVRETFQSLGGPFETVDASQQFLEALRGVYDPEEKRRIIGEQFVKVQEAALEEHHVLEEGWLLGQGTIYPDTIESGGTEKAAVIKTHHNRVPAIQRMIEEGRLLEPLRWLYKDEVRALGRELGLPAEILQRHPFPGPGLAVRCLCTAEVASVERVEEGWLLPVRSVGVQGDARTYTRVMAIEGWPVEDSRLHRTATELTNRSQQVNRVVSWLASKAPLREMRSLPAELSAERLARLREADARVRNLCRESGFEKRVWQMPVILIPLGVEDYPDSVVLRPVDSTDGMTAESVPMPARLLEGIVAELLKIPGVCAVFYDLTHKPPATIEWE